VYIRLILLSVQNSLAAQMHLVCSLSKEAITTPLMIQPTGFSGLEKYEVTLAISQVHQQ
jgi:hypothetical protein